MNLNLPQQSSPAPTPPQSLGAPAAPAAAPAQGQPQQAGPNPQALEAIENYISGLAPDQHEIIKAAASYPEFAPAMEVLFGPDMGLYFAEINAKLQQQNSQGQPPQGEAPMNPAEGAPAPAGQSAEATPPAPQLNVGM